jgi:beta-aspartyl-peptidase (threonine type)
MTSPVLLIHGGAWAMPDDAVQENREGIAASLAAGYAQLERGGSALDAVEAAVAAMEDHEAFDAGRGSFLTRDGRVQLDALLMNGENLRAGGVACVERIRNPIRAARLVLDKSPHVYFVGIGAERFALQNGMALVDNTELILPRERKRLMDFQTAELAGAKDTTFSGTLHLDKEPEDETPAHPPVDGVLVSSDPTPHSHDTVGAVALDAQGHIAAATSTGGTLSKAPGRVGDSSLIGCGCYADDASAAVSLTGWGEPIMKLVLGKWAVDRVAQGMPPEEAAQAAISYLYSRLGGHGGIILLDRQGRIGLAHNTPRMAWGLQTAQGVQVGVTRNL